jgi:hypothetical protein
MNTGAQLETEHKFGIDHDRNIHFQIYIQFDN